MYYILFTLLIIINFLTNYKYRKASLIISFVVLYLFSAFRYDFGNDYMSYFQYFQKVKNGVTDLSIGESGFLILCKIFPNFYLLIAFISLVFFITIYFLITRTLDPKLYPFALLILLIDPYLFLMSLSAIRQTLAALIFVIAVHFALKKNIIVYMLLCVLAFFIHTSAILMFPLYFFINTKKSFLFNKYFLIVFTISILVTYDFLFDPIVRKVLNLIGNANYMYYYESKQTNSIRATLLSSISFFYVIFNLDKLDGKDLAYGKLSVIFYLCDILSFKIPLMSRIGKYFAFYCILTLPTIFYKNSKEAKGWNRPIFGTIFPTLIFMIFCLRIYSFFTNPMWAKFTEYKTIFESFFTHK